MQACSPTCRAGDLPAGLVQRLPVQVSIILLQVVSTEKTTTDHVTQFESSIEFNKAMTTCLESRNKDNQSEKVPTSLTVRPPGATDNLSLFIFTNQS